jgi:hypothetical protein
MVLCAVPTNEKNRVKLHPMQPLLMVYWHNLSRRAAFRGNFAPTRLNLRGQSAVQFNSKGAYGSH